MVFRWRNPWGDVGQPLIAAAIAGIPAGACHVMLDGITGQVIASGVFLSVYGGAWLYNHRSASLA